MLEDLDSAALTLLDYRRRGSPFETQFVTALNEACTRSSGKAIAEALGVSNQYLSDVKRGRRRVSDKLLVRIVGENPFLAEPSAEPCAAEASGLNAFPARPFRFADGGEPPAVTVFRAHGGKDVKRAKR